MVRRGRKRKGIDKGCVNTFGSLALNTSILLRKRMIEVRKNHRELTTDSKRTRDSAMRFCSFIDGERDLNTGDPFTYLALILEQDLIIFRQCGTEDDTCNALEIVYPLLTF